MNLIKERLLLIRKIAWYSAIACAAAVLLLLILCLTISAGTLHNFVYRLLAIIETLEMLSVIVCSAAHYFYVRQIEQKEKEATSDAS